MMYQNILLKKWIKVYDQSGDANNRYKPNIQIRSKTSMLPSNLCDYSVAYIDVEGTIIVTKPNIDAYDKKLAFKNNAPFISWQCSRLRQCNANV